MAIKVVDASALAALLFGEPDAETVAGRLAGAQLIAPALLDFELTNVCVVKMRRQPGVRATLAAAFKLRAHMELETVGVDHDGVLHLAQSTKLTAYDASYLWLARKLSAELVTLDRQLAQAALS